MALLSVLLLLSQFGIPTTFAHGNHHHSEPVSHASLTQIGAAYERTIRPIFAAKCFDCHSDQTRYPWYHKLPLVKQWLNHDVTDGRKHLDMSGGYPFAGHGSPVDDLQALQETLVKDTMPPGAYRLMHPSSKVTSAEIATIQSWITESMKQLKEENRE